MKTMLRKTVKFVKACLVGLAKFFIAIYQVFYEMEKK